jgi:uncharacterized membrane protein (DUF4010 family)
VTVNEELMGIGIGVGLGLIIGLEREWAEDKPIGVRSFMVVAVTGALGALVTPSLGSWIVPAGLVAFALILAVLLRDRGLAGVTTLFAVLAVFLLSAAAVAGYWAAATVVGGAVALLLHWKRPLHQLIGRIGSDDIEIIARFVLIALVILPVLPNRTFGPLDVFNPFETWLLVVLIVGLNLVGFVAFRFVGASSAAGIAGVLGGLTSSTAATVSYAALSKRAEDLGSVVALVILLASTILYVRVIIELFVVAPSLVASVAGPSAVFSVVMLVLCLIAFVRARRAEATELPERANPAQIRLALAFAAIYVVVLFAVEIGRTWLGEEAIYAVAIVSGLTNVDALTLSVGQQFERQTIDKDLAWRAIFLSTLANLVFKAGAACVLGSAPLRVWILSTVAVALGAGGAILWLWPTAE